MIEFGFRAVSVINCNYLIKMAVSSRVESLYPIWKSCSYLAINYYEEISNKFEEYLSEALIPENSLLSDVHYPLQNIDKFYRSPWIKAEYDKEFFSKEISKTKETILNICENAGSSAIEIEDNLLNEDNFPKTTISFDAINFETENIDLRNKFCESSENYQLLEVPLIPHSGLHLRVDDTSLKDLTADLSMMELENIFEEEKMFSSEDLEESVNFIPLTPEKNNFNYFNSQNFKEMVLPEIPDENINLEDLSLCDNESSFQLDFTNKLHCENVVNEALKVKNDVTVFTNAGQNSLDDSDTTLGYEGGEKCVFFANSNNLNKNITCADQEYKKFQSLSQEENKYKRSKINSKDLDCISKCEIIDETEKLKTPDVFFSPLHKDLLFENKCDEAYVDNNKESCVEEFSENYSTISIESDFDKDDSITEEHISHLNCILDPDQHNIYNSPIRSSDSHFLQSNHTQVFLKKLSKLDYNKTADDYECGAFNLKKKEENLKSSPQCSSAYWNKILTNPKSPDENSVTENSYSSSVKSFSLLSSHLYLRKKVTREKKTAVPSLNFCQQNVEFSEEKPKSEIIMNNRKLVSENKAPNLAEPLLPSEYSTKRNILQFPAEDIIIKLPDNYVELVLEFEKASSYYIQKLVFCERFQILPLDLKIIDISLDTTRFLLNQEMKTCRDNNIRPLSGGVKQSYYVQLLVLHGILKSLNCLIHFDVQLSISSLHEFERKHSTALTGNFNDLIKKVAKFVENLPEVDSVHPKIKQMGTYLLEKYCACKNSMINFKVLIIVKQHLKTFYSRFESFLISVLPEIPIDMIPESTLLQQDSTIFSGYEDRIFVACVSSLSKNLLWKNLTLVIEYESDDSVFWKSICDHQNVAHAFVKFDSLPLKTLNEIKTLPLIEDLFPETRTESKPHTIIVSSSVCFKYNLKQALDNKQNVLLYERSYKMHLPHLHFADIVVDHRTGLLIVEMNAFLNEDFLNELTDQIFNLYLKYEILWVICRDDLTKRNFSNTCWRKIQWNFYKFYHAAVTRKIFYSVKIKFLYSEKSGDVVKWINHILFMNLNKNLKNLNFCPVNSLCANMKQEEMFLMSFPSLNPIVVSFILSSKLSLHQLINLHFEELCNKYMNVPKRFLKHFYELLREKMNSNQYSREEFHTEEYNSMPKSALSAIHSKNNQLHNQLNSGYNEIVNFDSSEDFNIEDESYNINLPCLDLKTKAMQSSPQSEISTEDNSQEMSLEEIDKSYRELQLQDIKSGVNVRSYTSSDDICASLSDNTSSEDTSSYQFSLPTSKRFKPGTITTTNDMVIHQSTKNIPFKETHSFDFDHLAPSSTTCAKNAFHELSNPVESISPELNFNSPNNVIKVKQKVSFLNVEDTLNSQKTVCEKANFSRYRYSKRKKSTADYPSWSKSMKRTMQSSPELKHSFRIQKGLSSKTVCTQKWFREAPLSQTDVNNEPYPSSSNLFQCSHSQYQTTDLADSLNSELSQKVDMSDLSKGYVTLTPRTKHKLSYEKIPGKKGQTRLVFH